MSNIEVGKVVRIIDDDRLWTVEYIIGKKCTLKSVDEGCYKEVNIGLLILVKKINQYRRGGKK